MWGKVHSAEGGEELLPPALSRPKFAGSLQRRAMTAKTFSTIFPPLSPVARAEQWCLPASGLYYLSELVEEHTVLTKKLLTRVIYGVIAVQILLAVVDRFPALLSLLSIGSHAVYAGNLRHFPTVRLSDPILILSCVLVILNHFFWFRHFSTPPSLPPPRYANSNRYDRLDIPSFTEIASYFGLCVWFVPFALFVSLSAGENVLPSMGSEYATGESTRVAPMDGGLGGGGDRRGRKAKGLVKAAIDGTMEWVNETGQLMGFWRGDRRRF